jgi:pre-mRNA-processing factor 19
MVLCASKSYFLTTVSGEVPSDPVVSKKSGHVFEKRLVLAYVKDKGTCPVTGEMLAEEDLLTLKPSTTIKLIRSESDC